MKRQILIVEDKKAHRDALCKIIYGLKKDIEVCCAANAADAYQIALEKHIHLFLVDIILNGGQAGDTSGLKFVQEMRGIKRYAFAPVIFITSLEDPKLFSYSQLHCFEYIEKPFNVEQIEKCVSQALDFPVVEDEERSIFLRKDGIIYAKNLKDIIYIESGRRKMTVYCVNDSIDISYMSCEKMLKELDSSIFVQCSRFIIINRQFVEEIDYGNRYIKLRGIERLLEIGTRMKQKFKSEMENGSSSS